jgi:hypothetical protein
MRAAAVADLAQIVAKSGQQRKRLVLRQTRQQRRHGQARQIFETLHQRQKHLQALVLVEVQLVVVFALRLPTHHRARTAVKQAQCKCIETAQGQHRPHFSAGYGAIAKTEGALRALHHLSHALNQHQIRKRIHDIDNHDVLDTGRRISCQFPHAFFKRSPIGAELVRDGVMAQTGGHEGLDLGGGALEGQAAVAGNDVVVLGKAHFS